MPKYLERVLDESQREIKPLLSFAEKYCSSGSLVVRDTHLAASQVRSLKEKIGTAILGIDTVSSWPGTELLGDTATLVRFTLNRQTIAFLNQHGNYLDDFVDPEPEDLALYRPDGSVFLTSIAHEEDFFLNLTSEEDADWSLTSQ